MLTSRIQQIFSSIFLIFIIFISSNSYGFDRRFALTNNNGLYSLDIKLEEGYKIYWLNPGDIGKATSIDLSRSKNIANSTLLWPFPEEEITNDGKIISYIYKGDISIPIIIKTKNSLEPVDLNIDLNYVICEKQCLAIKQTIDRKISVIEKNPLMNKLSINNLDYNDGLFSFDASFSSDIDDDLKFIIVSEDKILQYSSVIEKTGNIYNFLSNIPYDSYRNLIGKGFYLYSNHSQIPVHLFFPNVNGASNTPLYMAMIFGLIGGFILNFMPCVLPVLALKIMSITKIDKNYKKSFAVTIFGIMFSFWILSIASITIKDIGIGLGFQKSEFLILLTILMVIFISIAIGRININIPSFLYEVSFIKFGSKYIEDFMSGVVATLFSIPCTAPFLGTAMAAAILGSSFSNFMIFTSVGIGFSLPYILCILSPHFLEMMPKSGKWMVIVKKGLAILLIASLIWIISILYSSIGTRGTIGLTMILILIKYIIEEKESMRGKIFLRLSIFIALIFGSLYLPQMAHKEDESYKKYVDSIWQEFDPSKINEDVKTGKIVIVDITADWCLTCKFNKIRLWNRSSTLSLISSPSIVAMRADITKQNPMIEQFLLEHNIYGIPFSIIYGPKAPEGIVLPVTPNYNDLKKAIDSVSNN